MNRQIVLRRRPEGLASADCFELVESPVPDPGPGGALVRMLWLAVDAGMLNRLRAEENYAARVEIGDVMQGNGIGQVVASDRDDLPVGTFVRAASGWQEYSVIAAGAPAAVVDDDPEHLPHHLGHLGSSGFAAYLGVVDVLRPQAGQTLVISSAGGSVGSVAGQIGRILGCRVVGIAGGADKCRYVVERLGFDACVDHRAGDLPAQLAEALPDGVDGYFDNVGGSISEALLPHYNVFGRIAVCGRIGLSHLADTSADIGLRDHNTVLVKRLTKQGFLIFDHEDRRAEAIDQLRRWHAEGALVVEHTVAEGIESTPRALEDLLAGRNLGKQLVHLADPA